MDQFDFGDESAATDEGEDANDQIEAIYRQ